LGFASVYEAMAIHGDAFPAIHTKIDAVYFTVVTLGTVGFGDITPATQVARLVVTFQIAFNLLFLGGAVRLLTHVGRQRHIVLNEERGIIPPDDEV
jgi:voltage-gated potassium channel